MLMAVNRITCFLQDNRTKKLSKIQNRKVLVKLFQKLAGSRGGAPCRSPQRAKHFIRQPGRGMTDSKEIVAHSW